MSLPTNKADLKRSPIILTKKKYPWITKYPKTKILGKRITKIQDKTSKKINIAKMSVPPDNITKTKI